MKRGLAEVLGKKNPHLLMVLKSATAHFCAYAGGNVAGLGVGQEFTNQALGFVVAGTFTLAARGILTGRFLQPVFM